MKKRYSPLTPGLRRALEHAVAMHHAPGEETVLVLGKQYRLKAALKKEQIEAGEHVGVVQEIRMGGGTVTVAHLGLYSPNKVLLNIYKGDRGEELYLLNFSPPKGFRVLPVTEKARQIWDETWQSTTELQEERQE